MVRWLLASLHLLGLGVGLGAIVVRARALRGPLTPKRLATIFRADNLWGLAAVLWLSTGLLRAFAGFEKGTDYYLGNQLFHAKLATFILIAGLEVTPMVTLVQWRLRVRRGQPLVTDRAPTLAGLSVVQAVLVVVMVLLATGIARGYGS